MVLKSKNVYGIGLVEIRESSIAGSYDLWVAGQLKGTYSNLNDCIRDYDRIG